MPILQRLTGAKGLSHDDRKRAIGKVVSVAADRFVVEMHAGTDNFTVVGFDGVHYVARLGSFLMIPSQSEYVVVEVVGLRGGFWFWSSR